MKAFKDQPIARKAVILGLAPTICALVIAGIAFILSVYVSVRRDIVNDIAASASMVADSTNLAVSVRDSKTISELAAALRERTSIDRVCVFDAAGEYLGGYARSGEACPRAIARDVSLRAGQVHQMQDVYIDSRRVGVVHVVGNLDQVYRTVGVQAGVTVLALFVAAAVALLLIGRLQRSIAQPVSELAQTADRVSSTNDYGLRARQTTNDEVGSLVRSFNAMLGAIQRAEGERTRLLQREREASRLKDEFLAAVSHELRTPLNAILGWTHILSTTNPPPETLAKGLKTLHRNARTQTRLIEDLIEVSRIATGKLNLKVEVVDLRDVVKQATDSLQGTAAAKPVALEVTVPSEPALVSGDRDRLQQVAWNLLSNAIKFTPPEGVVVVTLGASGSEFVLRVRDTGIGISPDFLPFVFERFRQADGSTTREFGGLGLGLSIVHDLVNLHHGTVTASSAGRGLGAEFVVRLRQLVESPTEESASGPAAAPKAEIRLPDVDVLVVDDNEDSLELVATTLAGAGARVRVAHTGAEAIAAWKATRADVLVCDLAMPAMNGFDVLREIRTLDEPSGVRTFAIALTAYASGDYVERARLAGFDAHLAKPFDPAVLLTQIASAST
ncbi:MAG TPA: hybrid sensor histidine kinase/response regulator [Vicinamibacterales bacterium]|jgi:signal transduction histidine kinase/ActR/RegA family two-component response regulator|nr:hybrid sensor histidine kinase/response regulator [Vicinamibacterales bacterium]